MLRVHLTEILKLIFARSEEESTEQSELDKSLLKKPRA